MKNILVALAVFASVAVASAQTETAQEKPELKKECTKKKSGSCCAHGSKAKAVSSGTGAKKAAAQKG